MELCSHTEDISVLQKKLRSHLPGPLRDHVTVANYDNKSLHLHTDNAAWATRLRFKIPEILDIARNKCELTNLQTIRIKVAPSECVPPRPDQLPKLSAKTSLLLRNIGESLTDPGLRSAFLQLSRNRED